MKENQTKETGRKEPAPIQKLNDEVANAFESCANALSLNELSRVTGVRIELLRRFISKKTRRARAETWDKIYPALKPYLVGPEPAHEPPPRVGPAYRRHHELVEMFSDQKVLLDEFDVLAEPEQKKVIAWMEEMAGAETAPTAFESLTPLENQVMGSFLALSREEQQNALLKLTDIAVAEVRRRRKELF